MRTIKLIFTTAAAAALASALVVMSAQATEPGKNGQIAFHRAYGRAGVTAGIFVMNPDGTGLRQLTHPAFRTQDEAPDFAPDGSNVIFTHRDNHFTGSIWRVNLNGSSLRRIDPRCPAGGCLHEDTSGAVYSPNGKQIAFSRLWGPPPANNRHGPPEFSALYLMSASGTHLRKLSSLKTKDATVNDPGWSPDGKRIVFVRIRRDSKRALFITGANGGRARQLTPWNLNGGDRPDFSPDGTRIVFRSPRTGRAQGFGEGGNYYTVRADGSGLTQVTHFDSKAALASARFSPDGQSIVFGYNPTGGEADIYTMRLDGTGLARLTSDPGWESSPDWATGR